MSRLGFIYNMDECIGCKACQVACKDKNHLEIGEYYRRVDTLEVNGEYIQFSGACNHCANPSCVTNCPTGAMYVANDGTVQHDSGKCIGCGNCVWSCPYGSVTLSKQKGIASKCNSCADLRANGEQPACVQACITKCLKFGEIEDDIQDLPSFMPSPTKTNPSFKIIRDTRKAIVEDSKKILIIGNGIAGLTAASTVREMDKDCDITIVDDEKHLTYSRPMITKAPLIGFDDDKFIVKSEDWYKENKITNILDTKVVSLDIENKTAELSNGEKLEYTKCIFASGAESFVPPIPGRENKGVFVARKLEDIAKIRKHRLMTKTAVVIGGGVIGLEMAWELRKTGLKVIVLEVEKSIMERLLDKQSSELFRSIIESEGIEVYTDVVTESINGSGIVESVSLKDGRKFDAEMVVLSCGIRANSLIAKDAGIEVNRGILVDEHMRTSNEDIYACGDCAEYNGINLAIWKQAVNQAEVAGRNICGEDAVYDQIKGTILFNGMHTSMVVIGDAGKNVEKQYSEIVVENEDDNKLFQVNKITDGKVNYIKYFFADNVLVGAIMIGNLKKKNIISEAIENNMTYEEFKNNEEINGGSL